MIKNGEIRTNARIQSRNHVVTFYIYTLVYLFVMGLISGVMSGFPVIGPLLRYSSQCFMLFWVFGFFSTYICRKGRVRIIN